MKFSSLSHSNKHMENKMGKEKLNKERGSCKNGKDKTFKDRVKVKGYEEYVINHNDFQYYIPDKVLRNKDSIIILESSSTGDRKVHVGELTQFLTYVSCCNENLDFYFVLFLCGNSNNSPKKESEKERLKYYYNNYSIKNIDRKKIKGIYVANQNATNIEELTLEKIKTFERIDEED